MEHSWGNIINIMFRTYYCNTNYTVSWTETEEGDDDADDNEDEECDDDAEGDIKMKRSGFTVGDEGAPLWLRATLSPAPW